MTLALLSACPAPYIRIDRKVEADITLDIPCLIEMFRSLTPHRGVTYSVGDTDFGTSHGFFFTLSKSYYNWTFLVKPNGSVTITHSSGVDKDHMEKLPSIRDAMKDVERRVQGQCGLGNIMTGATEYCGVQACGG